MKVLVLLHGYNIPTETFIRSEVAGIERQHTVRTIAMFDRGLTAEKDPRVKFVFSWFNSIRLRWIQRKFYGFLCRFSWDEIVFRPLLKRKIQAEIKSFRPDIIHVHFGTTAKRLEPSGAYDAGPAVFVSFHGMDASAALRSPRYIDFLHGLFARPNVYPVFSSHAMLAKVRSYGLNVQRESVIYYGTDVDYFKRARREKTDAPFVFLQVSSFRDKKGHAHTIRAFAEVRRQGVDARLVFTGEGECRGKMEALVRTLALEPYVDFVGWADRRKVKALMEEANAFVHHSVTTASGDMEGIPNAIMEAMAMELPVISTYHAGIPELVEDGVNGYLVEERDEEAYAQRMKDVLTWGYVSRNRQKVIEEFSQRAHRERLARRYQEAAAAREAGRAAPDSSLPSGQAVFETAKFPPA